MANTTIPNLPSATSLTGSEQLEVVQSGVSVKTTTGALASLNTTTGTVTSIATNAPIQGGTITTTGTISLQVAGVDNTYLAPMAPYTIKGNNTAGTVSPQDLSAASVLAMIGAGTVTSVNTGAGLTGGPITTSGTIALDVSGVTAGTYGSTTAVGQFSVDNYGRIILASNQTINIPSSQVSGLGTMATQNANNVAITGGTIDGAIIGGTTPAAATFTALTATGTANFSTIASGTWNGSTIGIAYGGTGATTASGARSALGAAASGANSDITSLSGLTTPLSAPQGGTGFGSYTTGDLLYADTSSTLARLNDVATGNALISGGVGVAPSWGKIGLTTHVSGTLPVANGGSGATTLTGFLKGNGTSPFTAQATIDNADLTNSSVTIGSTSISLGGNTSTISGLTTLTLTQDPTSALQASTKQYVDDQVATVSNQTFHTQTSYATTIDLGSVTYSNGTGGVGATLTNAGAQVALQIDGYTFTASDVTNQTRVLVKNESNAAYNGIYIVTAEGSGSSNWQLQRSTDYDTVGAGPTKIQTGSAVFVTDGNTNGSTSWVMTTTGTITVGSTSLNWAQTSSSGNISVTSPLVKVGNNISLGTVGVANGGTGLTSLTAYGLLYAPTTSSVAQISPSTAGQPLLSTGPSSPASFGALSLSGAGVTGTLGVSNGGTGTNVALTTGSVVFAGASGVYSQDAELFWDNTNKWLGIGTNTPRAELTIVSPTQTVAPSTTLPAGTDLYIVGADSANTRITQDAYGSGNYAAYTGRHARGTAASPTATQTGDILVEVTGRGYGTTTFSSSSPVRIDLEAAENFTDTDQGTYISLHTAALGTTSSVERFRVGPSGQWGIGGGTYGTSGYAFVSGGASAAPTWSQISLTSGVTGTLPAANGGTGLASYAVGDLLYADTTSTLARLADVATGNVLLSGGVGVAPSWGQVNLASMVTGTLPVANGGTGQSSALTQYGVVYGSTTSEMATTAAGTTGQVLIGNTGAAPTWSSTIPSTAGVTSFSAGTTGLTPSSATTGAVVLAGTLAVGNGGTGLTSYTTGDLLYASGSTTIAKLADVATGSVLVSGGVGVAPAWSASPTITTSLTTPKIIGGTAASSSLTLQSTSGIGTTDSVVIKVGNNGATTALTAASSGTVTIGTLNLTNALGVSYGGTGATTFTSNGILYGNSTSAVQVTAAGTTGQILVGNTGSAPSWSAATSVAVTSISFGSTGLTPSTATKGAVTVAGTLATGNGGTGLTTFTAANNAIYSTSSSALTAGTLPVAAGGTGATTLTGVIKGNGTSAFTAATAGTDFVAPGTATTFTATQTFNGSSSSFGAVITDVAETTTVSATAATGTINYDVTTQAVLYYTSNATANFTINVRGSSGTSLNTLMATGQTITIAFLNTNGATAYYANAFTIDGVAVTPKYQGGTAFSSGNASSIDVYTYTITKTGSATYNVLASQTQFK